MLLTAAFGNSDNVFSTVKLIFKSVVSTTVFEQNAELALIFVACSVICRLRGLFTAASENGLCSVCDDTLGP